ncbi:MAG: AbrB/MazE/SpoVT family DNA-binding domain-containing protein [Acidobacteriota bacterium]
MPIATVTSKGQVTIPKRVREHLDVKSGDKLEFRVGEDGTVSLVPITRSAESVFGAFAHKAKGAVSAAEAKQKVAAALRRKSSRAR